MDNTRTDLLDRIAARRRLAVEEERAIFASVAMPWDLTTAQNDRLELLYNEINLCDEMAGRVRASGFRAALADCASPLRRAMGAL